MQEKLKKLSVWLKERGLSGEANRVMSILRVSSENISYIVQSGDTLSGIASHFGIEDVAKIQKLNGMEPNDYRIFAGRPLKIPKAPATAADIVAMTLLGEGGTLKGASIMKEVMAVIKNRAECRGMSQKDVVLERNQFSYWNSRDPDRVLYSSMGKEHRLWDRALEIVQNQEVSADVGSSTHYYVFNTKQVSKEERNYEVKPSWADEKNPNAKWTEIYKGSHHVYGIDRSIRHYKNCFR